MIENMPAQREHRLVQLALLASLLLPLGIAVLWHDLYTEAGYQQLLQARALAHGGKLSWGEFSPLYTALLALADRFALPLSTVGLGLSTAGWLAAILAWFATGVSLGAPAFSVASAFLLGLHPLQPQALGLETGYVLASLGLISWWAVRRRSVLVLLTAAALVAVQPMALALAAPLLAITWVWRRRPPRLIYLAGALAFGITLYALATVVIDVGQLTVYATDPRPLVLLTASAQLLVAALFAWMASPLDWLAQPRADWRSLSKALFSIALVVTVAWQANTLWHDWRMRPVECLALYKGISHWLSDHALPQETVGTERPDLIEYLSGRAATALPQGKDSEAILAAIAADRPDFSIALNDLAWLQVRAHAWFQERYQEVYRLASPYDPSTPLTLFQYTSSPFDAGEISPVTGRFLPGEDELVELVGYRVNSQRLTPGVPLQLTLYWHAVTAVHRPAALSARVWDPTTGRVWARAENETPGGLAMDLWAPGMELTDHYTLVPPADLPAGDYVLDVALYPRQSDATPVPAGLEDNMLRPEPLSLTRLYRAPEISRSPPAPDQPLDFTFGDEIALQGYDLTARVAPGGEVRIALYWHALGPVTHNYKVFVHLFAAEGDLVAQQDGLPVNWAYPTTEWQPGDYVRDEHSLTLPEGTPRGDYALYVGLYEADTQVRPPVRDAAGQEMADRQVQLDRVQVR